MAATEMIDRIAAIPGRGAGTDAERRAALEVAGEIRRGGRDASLETFWCRPNWAAAHAWHVALGVAGSLLAVGSPQVGAVLIVIAVLSEICDATFGISPGRRLTLERASQNVVSPAPNQTERRVRLLITANLDAGRRGLVYRDGTRDAASGLRALTGDRGPGWSGWIVLALVWVLITALLRVEGSKGGAVEVLQLLPTVGLVIVLALLLDVASANFSPGAGDNASGVAVAVALARALDAAPPTQAAVEIVITGAGDTQGIGLRRHLRAHRDSHRATDTVVLGIAASGAGAPHWWRGDGSLLPLRFLAALRGLGAEVAALDPSLGLREHRGRGCSPAFPARIAGIPAITIGAVDARGLVPRSHQSADLAESVDPAAVDAILQTGLLLADAVDGYLAGLTPG